MEKHSIRSSMSAAVKSFMRGIRMLAFVSAFILLPGMEAYAQEPFVVYSDGTLTFDYGEKPAEGDVYGLTDISTQPGWEAKNKSITKVVFTDAFSQARPVSCDYWFNGCENLTEIVGLTNLDASEVIQTFYMFKECKKIEHIDMSEFRAPKLTVCGEMFEGCESLKSLDLRKFCVDNVWAIFGMFGNCKSLTSLDLRSFNLSNVTQMNQMFEGCENLRDLYISDDFKTEKLLPNWGTGNFRGCFKLRGAIPFENLGGEKVYDIDRANYTTGYCQKVVGAMGDELVGAAGEPLKIVDLELKDKVALVIDDDGVTSAMEASYTRDVTSDWATLCLPFAVDVTDEANTCWFYSMTGIDLDKGRIPVERITSGCIKAGVPVFVKRKDSGQTAITVVGMKGDDDCVALVREPENAASGNRLVGVFDAVAAPEDAYFIAKDRFRLVADYTGKNGAKGVKVYGYRAYIMTDGGAAAPAMLTIDENGGTSGIETVGGTADGGELFYGIDGRRLSSPHKGLNLVMKGGRMMKVMVK